MEKIKRIINMVQWEALMWASALIYLVFIDPYQAQHFTLCPYKNLGIDFCPGCGLGKSISMFYHFDFIHSLQTHPLGIIAFFLISYRIISLIKRKYFNNKNRRVIYG